MGPVVITAPPFPTLEQTTDLSVPADLPVLDLSYSGILDHVVPRETCVHVPVGWQKQRTHVSVIERKNTLKR